MNGFFNELLDVTFIETYQTCYEKGNLMKKQKITIIMIMTAALLTSDGGKSATTIIDDFSQGLGSGWKMKSFKGNTAYTPVVEDGRPALMAVARGTASGLFHKIRYDPRKTPWLKWSWKVDHVLKKGNALTRAGDDYPARVYVVFPSFLFWKTRAINYVWANRLKKDAVVANKYTGNAMMVAVESGAVNTGRWIEEKRNIYQDYRRLFHAEPPEVGAIAIMTDTDTTGEKALAWYGAISISDR